MDGRLGARWRGLPPQVREEAVRRARERVPLPGRRFRAAEVRADGDALRLDLSPAYPAEAGCLPWDREVRLDHAQGTVTAADRRRLADPDTKVHLQNILADEHLPGSLTLRGPQNVRLSWDPALGAGDLERHPVDDLLLREVWGEAVHRLVITARGYAFELTVTRGAPHAP